MGVDYRIKWETLNPVHLFAVGDVRPVINSVATRLWSIPTVTHGLGALTKSGPDMAGEGMILHHLVGMTPPLPDIGIEIGERATVSTPFFVGWQGSATAQGWFKAGEGVMLSSIYETAFQEARSRFGDTYIVLVEIVGLLPIKQIQDRALKKPVHRGNVLITSAEYQDDYFRAEIIRQDLIRRQLVETELFPLAIVGIGYLPGGMHPSLERLDQAVFYKPPTLGKEIATQRLIKTHSHAMGWRDGSALSRILGENPDDPNSSGLRLEQWLNHASMPDYVVHLDEWSHLQQGHVRLFIAQPDDIHFQG